MAAIKEWFGAYNVIFNWFDENFGKEELRNYWKFIAESCYDHLILAFKEGGLEEIRDYYEKTFAQDDGEFESSINDGKLIFEVKKCPDYDFLHQSDNPHFTPRDDYCEHHEVINSILADKSGYRFEMVECSHNGQCKWIFEEKGQET